MRRIVDQVLRDFGIPRETLSYIDYPTDYDCRDTQALLEGSGYRCLRSRPTPGSGTTGSATDPDLFKDLRGAIEGKVVVTGASSGIGHAVALKVGEAGGIAVLVARSMDKLEETKAADRGGRRNGHRSQRGPL